MMKRNNYSMDIHILAILLDVQLALLIWKCMKKKTLTKKKEKKKNIKKRLKELENYKSVHKIRHKGLLVGVELANKNINSRGMKKQPISCINGIDLSNYIMRESLKRGVFLRTLGNIVTLIPPLAMPRNQLDILIDTLSDIIKPIDEK